MLQGIEDFNIPPKIHILAQLLPRLEPGIYFTDGSGGLYSSDPRRRRCGWGIARIFYDPLRPQNNTLTIGWYGALPTQNQTVPRAELWAVIVVIEFAQGEITIYSDSK